MYNLCSIKCAKNIFSSILFHGRLNMENTSNIMLWNYFGFLKKKKKKVYLTYGWSLSDISWQKWQYKFDMGNKTQYFFLSFLLIYNHQSSILLCGSCHIITKTEPLFFLQLLAQQLLLQPALLLFWFSLSALSHLISSPNSKCFQINSSDKSTVHYLPNSKLQTD